MNWWITPLLAPDAGDGAAAPSGAATGGDAPGAGGALVNGGQQPAGAGGGGAPGAVADPNAPVGDGKWAPPEYIPAHLRDEDPAKFAAKVAEDWKRQRDEIGKRGAPPKDPAGYTFKPSDKVAPFVPKLENDPVFLAFRDQAHKTGMAPGQFQDLVSGFYETLVEKGVLAKPYNPGAERRAYLGEQASGMTDEQTIEAMRPHIASAEGFLNGLKRNGTLTAESVKALEPLLETHVGLRALAGLRGAMGGRGLQPGGDAGSAGGVTRTELQARMRDPRNDRSSGKYDAKFAAAIDADYKRLYGPGA
jgi:hypothetical protein